MSNDKKSHPDSHGSIIKSTSIMSLGTLTSRVLGFVRDIVFAKFFGTAAVADAFFVAFRIPNLFRDLVGEGAVNSALVPVFADYVERKDREHLNDFMTAVFILATGLLVILTVLGVLLAPWIVPMMAPGFLENPEKLHTTINLTRLMFPYLLMIGLTAYCMGILYTLRRFTAPAFSPCLLNICLIIAAIVSVKFMPKPIYGLAIGVLVGGLLQLLAQLPSLWRAQLRLVRPVKLFNSGVKRIGKLLLPRLFGSGVYQLTVFIDTFCASLAMFVGVGGISAIYYANRIIQFPLGVFGIALASAVLPSLSGMFSRDDKDGLRQTVIFSLENVFFILSPCAVLLLILSEPMIRLLFERGEFDQYSTAITSSTLMYYAFGLVSYGGIKILVTAFHSLQDTKTPVKVAALCLIINAALNGILMFPLKIGGIALASSIAATIDFLILFFILNNRVGGLMKDFGKYVIKLLFACAVMGFSIYHIWGTATHLSELVRLISVSIIGFLVFFAACSMMNLAQAVHIKKWAAKKMKYKVKS